MIVVFVYIMYVCVYLSVSVCVCVCVCLCEVWCEWCMSVCKHEHVPVHVCKQVKIKIKMPPKHSFCLAFLFSHYYYYESHCSHCLFHSFAFLSVACITYITVPTG